MGDGAQGQTAPGASPGGSGPAAGAGASTGGPPTKSLEEMMRDQDSMRKSIQDLTAIKTQQETRIKELEASGPSYTPPSETGYEEPLTRSQAKEIFRTSFQEYQTEQRKLVEAQQQQLQAFQVERQRWVDDAAKEVPEVLDQTSPVYKKAQEIFADPSQKLSLVVGGQLVPAFAAAEYVAITRAAKLVVAAGTTTTEKREGAAFASTGRSSGGPGPASGGSELSDADYMKLSPEERGQYRERKFAEKFPG